MGIADALLSTVVAGRLGVERQRAGLDNEVLKELPCPFGQGLGRGAVTDKREALLLEDRASKVRNRLLAQVLIPQGASRGVKGKAETNVEGSVMGGIQSEVGRVGSIVALLELDRALYILVEFVGCRPGSERSNHHSMRAWTRSLVNLVLEMTSASNSTKYGRSALRKLADSTMASRVWVPCSSPPRSSDSRVIRSAERLLVFCSADTPY